MSKMWKVWEADNMNIYALIIYFVWIVVFWYIFIMGILAIIGVI